MEKRISGYFDLLLDLDDNWQVTDLQTDYNTKEIQIRVEFIGKKGICPNTFDLCSIHDYTKLLRWHPDLSAIYSALSFKERPLLKNQK